MRKYLTVMIVGGGAAYIFCSLPLTVDRWFMSVYTHSLNGACEAHAELAYGGLHDPPPFHEYATIVRADCASAVVSCVFGNELGLEYKPVDYWTWDCPQEVL
jgi:hypothetical protein